MRSVIVVLFALIALAAAQSYVRVSTYDPSASPCSDSLARDSYVQVGECIVTPGATGSTILWVNSTTNMITQWICNNLNCSASGCMEFTLEANQCYAQIDADNVTFAYESYAVDVNTTADFAAVPTNALLTVMYPQGTVQCNAPFVYALISYDGNLCAPQTDSFANLQCTGGCLSVQAACQHNMTTDMCYGCPSGPTAVPSGCIAAFNAYVSCGAWGVETCNSTASTTTTGMTSGGMTTGGATTGGVTTGAGTTTSRGTTTGAGTTTSGGTTTGTTGSSAAVTTGSASSVVLSGFAVVAAAIAVFL